MHRTTSWAALALCAFFTACASGAVISYQTPVGATGGGQPVAARATFTTSANQVSILLENLQVDPTSVVQCISGLQFTLSTGQNAGSLLSSLGLERRVNDDASFDDLSNAASGWSLATVGSSLKLNVLGMPTAPAHLVIGPPLENAGKSHGTAGSYADANGSITGGPHNPFFGEALNFTVTVPGVTSQSSITGTTFQFNTSAGTTVFVPEPLGTAWVALLGCLVLTPTARVLRRPAMAR